jgi:hypothetical protein
MSERLLIAAAHSKAAIPLSAKPSRSRGGRGAPITVPPKGLARTLEADIPVGASVDWDGWASAGLALGVPTGDRTFGLWPTFTKADPSGADPRLFPWRPYIQNDSPHLKTLWSCGRLLIEPALGLIN